MLSIRSLLAGACFFAGALASEGELIYRKSDIAVLVCESVIEKAALLFEETDLVGFCNVDNQQALGTMAHCLKQVAHKGSVEAFIKSCEPYGLTEKEFELAYSNATKHLTNVTADPNFNLTELYYKPVLLSQSKIDAGYRSGVGRFYNYTLATWFGVALIAYWFVVMFIAGICNYVHFLFPGFVKGLKGSFTNTYRKYISLPALGRKVHAEHMSFLRIFQWVVPTRLESILIFVWYILALAFNVCLYNHDSPNLYWPTSESAEIGRKIADRTGIMSLFLIPTLILFAGRNNFMQWISGWSYSRFIAIHRWVSRVEFLLVMIHAVGMTYNAKGIAPGKYETRNAQEYVRWGYVALVAASIMCFHSLLVFRKKNYELFVFAHIILATLFIIGGWRHVEEEGYQQFFYAAVAVWVFDRVIRIGRLAAFGVQRANVELKANETLKVTVPRPAYWKPFPGCHAFIHFLRPTCFWQSHPFTIVDSAIEENTITFYLKVKGGVTHGLYQYLAKQPDHKAHMKVLVEGPYGQRIPIDKYDTTAFLVSANGIPGMYYEAMDLARRQADRQRVRFYWVIRHYKSVDWFYEELLKFEGTIVEPVIYVTQSAAGLAQPIGQASDSSESNSVDEKDEKDENNSSDEVSSDHVQDLKAKLSFVQFREGRPPINDLIQEEINEAIGSIAFVTCAHGSMCDDIRKSVADNLSTTKRVELFEQVQNW